MKTNLLIASIMVAASLAGCKKNVDPATSGFNFQLKAGNPSSTIARTMATVTWQSGFVNVDEIKFEAKQNGRETEFRSRAQQRVDLFAAVTTIGTISVPGGTFDEVEFKMNAAPASASPAVQLQGMVDNTPVVFQIDSAVEIKAEQHQVTLGSSTMNAVTTIDLSALTAGLTAADFSTAVQTNGTILISSATNTNLYNVIIANLKKLGGTKVELHDH